MESIQGVDREVSNVISKLGNFNSNEARRVGEAAEALRRARNDLQPGKTEKSCTSLIFN